MAEAQVNGFKMHYLDVGKGRPVVLLHGLGGNCYEWEAQTEALSKQFRVIVPDLRGHGRTDFATTPSYTPFDHAKDIVALLDHLQVQKAWAVGLSMGGFVTLSLALRHPEKLDGIILAATAPMVDADTKALTGVWMEIFRKQGLEAYTDRVLKDIFTLDFFEANHQAVMHWVESQKTRNFAGTLPSAAGASNFDVRKDLVNIHLPTLCVHGLNDRVIDPAFARRMRQAIQGAEVKLLTDTGHILIVERAAEFNEMVIEFITRTRGGPESPKSTVSPAEW